MSHGMCLSSNFYMASIPLSLSAVPLCSHMENVLDSPILANMYPLFKINRYPDICSLIQRSKFLSSFSSSTGSGYVLIYLLYWIFEQLFGEKSLPIIRPFSKRQLTVISYIKYISFFLSLSFHIYIHIYK